MLNSSSLFWQKTPLEPGQERFEQSLKQLGHFDVEPLPAEPKPRRRHEDMTQQTAYCL
jgi:hypothetical protein